ncbi:Hypothetical protein ABZS17G119_00420 [Kosakonia cowanii]
MHVFDSKSGEMKIYCTVIKQKRGKPRLRELFGEGHNTER